MFWIQADFLCQLLFIIHQEAVEWKKSNLVFLNTNKVNTGL